MPNLLPLNEKGAVSLAESSVGPSSYSRSLPGPSTMLHRAIPLPLLPFFQNARSFRFCDRISVDGQVSRTLRGLIDKQSIPEATNRPASLALSFVTMVCFATTW